MIDTPKNEHSVSATATTVPDRVKPDCTLSAQSWSAPRWVHTANASAQSSPATRNFWTRLFITQNEAIAPTTSAVVATIAMVFACSKVMAITPALYGVGTLVQVSDQPINLSTGLPTTVLPAPDPAVAARLDAALTSTGDERRSAVADVAASAPRFLDAWAALGDLGRDTIERYAAYRVGYHRGLDALRANGWRGSGYVRWSEPTNRGFLRCMRGLAEMAAEIGESDEAERCRIFLLQLDPSGIASD